MTQQKIIPIDFKKKADTLQVLPCSPTLSSRKLGWDNFVLERYRHPAHETIEHYSRQHIITIATEGQTTVERSLEGQFSCNQFERGHIVICPAGWSQWVRWHQESEFLVLSVEPEALVQALYGAGYTGKFELTPPPIATDGLIQQIGVALTKEAESSNVGCRIYVDTLFNLLSVHLLRFYSNFTLETLENTEKLAARKLQQAIDYIHDHLQQDLSLTEIAAILETSPYQAMCLFQQATGLTPLQYLTECRVERAKRLLKNSELTLTEVATQAGFSNESKLSKHFRRLTRITPKAYREE
jgi:AraC family transcriptional regulator